MTGTTVERLTSQDVGGVRAVWNEVVATGDAFPQTDELGADEAAGFFAAQSFTGVARGTGDSRASTSSAPTASGGAGTSPTPVMRWPRPAEAETSASGWCGTA